MAISKPFQRGEHARKSQYVPSHDCRRPISPGEKLHEVLEAFLLLAQYGLQIDGIGTAPRRAKQAGFAIR